MSSDERVHTTILGPSQRPGDYIRMRYDVKGTCSASYVGTPYKVTVTVDLQAIFYGEHCCSASCTTAGGYLFVVNQPFCCVQSRCRPDSIQTTRE